MELASFGRHAPPTVYVTDNGRPSREKPGKAHAACGRALNVLFGIRLPHGRVALESRSGQNSYSGSANDHDRHGG